MTLQFQTVPFGLKKNNPWILNTIPFDIIYKLILLLHNSFVVHSMVVSLFSDFNICFFCIPVNMKENCTTNITSIQELITKLHLHKWKARKSSLKFHCYSFKIPQNIVFNVLLVLWHFNDQWTMKSGSNSIT